MRVCRKCGIVSRPRLTAAYKKQLAAIEAIEKANCKTVIIKKTSK